MKWSSDLIHIAKWALRMEDLRHQMLFAGSPEDVETAPGVVEAYETVAVVRIFEAALAHGYRLNLTVKYECSYPDAPAGVNPKRADLAFKDGGPGQGWNYVEVKWYTKEAVEGDINKLLAMDAKTTRWMLVYRVVANNPLGRPPEELPFLVTSTAEAAGAKVSETSNTEFPCYAAAGVKGICQIWLGRITNA